MPALSIIFCTTTPWLFFKFDLMKLVMNMLQRRSSSSLMYKPSLGALTPSSGGSLRSPGALPQTPM